MKIITFLLLLMFPLLSVNALADTDKAVSSDVTVGYSFFSDEESNLFRNHHDVSDGVFIENLNLSIKSADSISWFNSITLNARTGDLFDNGEKISLRIKKFNAYQFTMTQTRDYDFFADSTYNYGANDRNLKRNRLFMDLKVNAIKNIQLSLGYHTFQSKSDMNLPHSNWGDIFSLRLDRDTQYEVLQTGIAYTKGRFNASFNQSWTHVDELSMYRTGSHPGAGEGGLPVEITDPQLTGGTESALPASKFSLGYHNSLFSLKVSYMNSDASIDNTIIDLKQYMFTDYGQRVDMLSAIYGSADMPMDELSASLLFTPFEKLDIGYNYYNKSLENESSMALTKELLLYGSSDTPLTTISSNSDQTYYYKNEKDMNEFFADFKATDHLTVSVSYTNTEGTIDTDLAEDSEMLSYLDTDYTYEKTKLSVKYKFKMGHVKVSAFNEDIENPLFHNAGKDKTGYSLSTYLMLNDKVQLNGMITKTENKDDNPERYHDDSVTLIDLMMNYTFSDTFNAGLGYSQIDTDYTTSLYYFDDETPVHGLETYNSDKKGYYLYATYTPNERIHSRLSVNYMDDTGSSFPLSNIYARLQFSIKLTDSLYGVISGRLYDYDEDTFAANNYNVNLLTAGIRWIYK